MKMFLSLCSVAAVVLVPMAAQIALAGPVYCEGELSSPSSYLNGNCFSGNCTINGGGGELSASGNCGGTVSFNASGYDSGVYTSVSCTGGNAWLNIPGETVSLSGTCSDGSAFSGQATIEGSYTSAQCQENGSISAFVSRSGSISGSCN